MAGLTKKRWMTNGMSQELDSAWKRLRIYAAILMIISLFFLGFSILSLYIARPKLAIYGLVCFGASTVTAMALFFDTFSHMGRLGLCNLLLANLLDTMYFLISTIDLHKSGYEFGYVLFSGMILSYFAINIFVGTYLLNDVLKLTFEDHDDEDSIEHNLNHVGTRVTTG